MISIRTLVLGALLITIHSEAQVPVNLELVSVASGFDNPVAIANAGDDRLFVVEKDGQIRILQPDGSIETVSFLNMQSLTATGGTNSEQGLLGLAFHPAYSENGYLFVNYTMPNGDTRIARFTVSANPNLVNPASWMEIITIDQPYGNHNGGCLKFGPDGYLYIGMGDGGSGGDPEGHAQNVNSLLGKMLRLDVDNGLPYSIPDDNPFVGLNPLNEIWAIGLRNPWRFSFDSQTGDLWIGDVGQSSWEEIDYQPASSVGGENYGWRCSEGLHPFNTMNCSSQASYDLPIAEFSHSDGHCSLTGGEVYRGAANLDMQGKYFCVDYCSGQFWSVEPDDANGWVVDEVTGNEGLGWSAFGADSSGELYVANQSQGIIYQLVDEDCVGFEPTVSVDGTTLSASVGVSYQWYLNGQPLLGANLVTLVATSSGEYSVGVESAVGCFEQSASIPVSIVGCASDFNGDGQVDVADFLLFNSAFGSMCDDCPEDLNSDGTVDIADFLMFNSEFGAECE